MSPEYAYQAKQETGRFIDRPGLEPRLGQSLLETKTKEIPDMMERLEREITVLEETCYRLIETISPIIRNTVEKEAECGKVRQTNTSLGGALECQIDRIYFIRNKIQNITELVEV